MKYFIIFILVNTLLAEVEPIRIITKSIYIKNIVKTARGKSIGTNNKKLIMYPYVYAYMNDSENVYIFDASNTDMHWMDKYINKYVQITCRKYLNTYNQCQIIKELK